MCAVENGHMETVCVLLFNYADPSITDCEGKKAVDYIKFAKNLKNQEENFQIIVMHLVILMQV